MYLTTYKDQMIKPPAHHLNKKLRTQSFFQLNEKQLIKRFTPLSHIKFFVYCTFFSGAYWIRNRKKKQINPIPNHQTDPLHQSVECVRSLSSNMFFDSLSFSPCITCAAHSYCLVFFFSRLCLAPLLSYFFFFL